MVDTFKGDRENLWNWAFLLLRGKGHAVGETIWLEGAVKTEIDGVPRTPNEAIRIATRYTEWPGRERGHLEYLRSLQSL